MTIETFIKNMVKKAVNKMFDLDKLRFNKIILTRELISNIQTMAKNAHPKEFLAFLDGKIIDNTLKITGLVYQEYNSNENSASPIFHFPDHTFYGSVHSHPNYNNKPSLADKRFFRKIGIINIIICNPYTSENIKIYNQDSEEINIEII
jgi:proteasome lid subunit RPN8/RPN11